MSSTIAEGLKKEGLYGIRQYNQGQVEIRREIDDSLVLTVPREDLIEDNAELTLKNILTRINGETN